MILSKYSLISLFVCACELARASVSSAQVPLPAVPEGMVLVQPSMPAGVVGVVRSLNETLSRDVQPRENAAVFLVQVIGLDIFEEKLQDASLDMLGIRKLSDAGPRLVYFPDWLEAAVKAGRPAPPPETPPAAQQFLTANERIWRREDFPLLADYLDANTAALDLVAAASRLPKYYAPLLSEEDPPMLLSASFSVERRMSYLAQCLAARALLRFGDGKTELAYADLMACHQLARLLAIGSPLDVSGAKAHTVDALACRAEKALIESGKLTETTARNLLTSLRSLPPLPLSARAADIGERAILHQEMEAFRAGEEFRKEFFEAAIEKDAKQADQVANLKFQFDLALRRADELQDEIVQALSIPEPTQQLKRFQELDERYAAWYARIDAEEQQIVESFGKDPAVASRWLGENMAMSLRTNLWQRVFTDMRERGRREMNELALALIIVRQRAGEYPASLESLAPEFFAKVPTDPYSGKPYTYQKPAAGRAHLISWGPNGENDAGRDVNDDVIFELR